MELHRPPGPRGLKVRVRTILAYRKDPFQFYEDAFRRYGPIFLSESFGLKFFVISSPDDIEHVLVRNSRNYTKDFFLQSWKRVFGEGLLTAEGENWKRERRMVQPSFHRDRMQRYGELMIQRTLDAFRRWSVGKGGSTIAADREMTALTLDIVVRALFGTELAPGTVERVGEALELCGRYFVFSGQPIGHFLAKLPLPVTRGYRKGVEELESVIYSILKARRGATDSSSGSLDKKDDLLSTLLSARDEDGSALSEKQIRDELLTLFLAGHDTTALTLTYSLYLLGKYPDIQEKARKHVQGVLHGKRLEVAHLEQLTYIKQVVQEALRLYPPAWVIARQAVAEDRLSGFAVPAGADIVIPIRAIHRKADHFAEPDKFRPERWTEEFTRSLPRAAYLPFGFGPRMCIGSSFAMMEAQLILAAILNEYEITTVSPQEVRCRPSITAKPKEEVRILLEPLAIH